MSWALILVVVTENPEVVKARSKGLKEFLSRVPSVILLRSELSKSSLLLCDEQDHCPFDIESTSFFPLLRRIPSQEPRFWH